MQPRGCLWLPSRRQATNGEDIPKLDQLNLQFRPSKDQPWAGQFQPEIGTGVPGNAFNSCQEGYRAISCK